MRLHKVSPIYSDHDTNFPPSTNPYTTSRLYAFAHFYTFAHATSAFADA